MSEARQKILARFVYQVDAIPKGARATRRIDLWAPCELEITSVVPDDVAAEAIVVQPRLDHAGHAGAIPLSLAAYGGLLWSPMKPLEYHGERRNFAHLPSLTIEAYLDQFRGEFSTAIASDDPVLAAYDRLRSEPDRFLPHPNTLREDDFDGRILWSNRSDMLLRHASAARDVLFVGPHVYTRRPEPTWSIADSQWFNDPLTGNGGVVLTGLANYNLLQRFRLDRLDDAMAWRDINNPKLSKTVHGAIIQADFSVLRRDDLACMIFDVLPAVMYGQATMALPYFSPEGIGSWRVLNDCVRSVPTSTFLDDRLEISLASATEHLSILARELSNPALPRHLVKPLAEPRRLLQALVSRADFELQRVPDIEILPADEAALHTLKALP